MDGADGFFVVGEDDLMTPECDDELSFAVPLDVGAEACDFEMAFGCVEPEVKEKMETKVLRERLPQREATQQEMVLFESFIDRYKLSSFHASVLAGFAKVDGPLPIGLEFLSGRNLKKEVLGRGEVFSLINKFEWKLRGTFVDVKSVNIGSTPYCPRVLADRKVEVSAVREKIDGLRVDVVVAGTYAFMIDGDVTCVKCSHASMFERMNDELYLLYPGSVDSDFDYVYHPWYDPRYFDYESVVEGVCVILGGFEFKVPREITVTLDFDGCLNSVGKCADGRSCVKLYESVLGLWDYGLVSSKLVKKRGDKLRADSEKVCRRAENALRFVELVKEFGGSSGFRLLSTLPVIVANQQWGRDELTSARCCEMFGLCREYPIPDFISVIVNYRINISCYGLWDLLGQMGVLISGENLICERFKSCQSGFGMKFEEIMFTDNTCGNRESVNQGYHRIVPCVSCSVVLLHQEQLIVSSARNGLFFDPACWGLVQAGENPYDAAIRELKEEIVINEAEVRSLTLTRLPPIRLLNSVNYSLVGKISYLPLGGEGRLVRLWRRGDVFRDDPGWLMSVLVHWGYLKKFDVNVGPRCLPRIVVVTRKRRNFKIRKKKVSCNGGCRLRNRNLLTISGEYPYL